MTAKGKGDRPKVMARTFFDFNKKKEISQNLRKVGIRESGKETTPAEGKVGITRDQAPGAPANRGRREDIT